MNNELKNAMKQIQLDCWKVDLTKFQVKASEAKIDIQIEMNKHIRSIGMMIEICSLMLLEFTNIKNFALDPIELGLENAMLALGYSMDDARKQFNL